MLRTIVVLLASLLLLAITGAQAQPSATSPPEDALTATTFRKKPMSRIESLKTLRSGQQTFNRPTVPGPTATRTLSADEEVHYCAYFDPVEAGGARGSFSMSLSPSTGSSRNNLALDLTELTGGAATKCNLGNGLVGHIHALWTLDKQSASNAECLSTGGHYDPALACSPSTDSVEQCKLLKRTAADGYKYECSSALFESGATFACEVGDLSGKLDDGGLLKATFVKEDVLPDGASVFPSRVFQVKNVVDSFAPMPYYHADTPRASSTEVPVWSSVVFHCHDDMARLVCARLVRSDGPCTMPTNLFEHNKVV